MLRSRSLPRLIGLAAAVAVLLSAPSFDAAASAPVDIPLDQSTLSLSGDTGATVTTPGGEAVDAADSLLRTAQGLATSFTIVAPVTDAGDAAATATLSLTSRPADATVTVYSGEHASTLDSTESRAVVDASTLSAVVVTFDAAGEFGLRVETDSATEGRQAHADFRVLVSASGSQDLPWASVDAITPEVDPAPAPDEEQTRAADATPVVLESGAVSITPLLTAADDDASRIGSATLGLFDDSAADPDADRPWYAPAQAVLHLGESSRQSDGSWTTASEPAEGRLSMLIDLNIRSVDSDRGLTWPYDQLNAGRVDDVFGAGRPSVALTNVTGPAGGDFTATSGVSTYYASEALFAGETQSKNVQIGVRRELQFQFSQAGRYCLTFAERLPTNSRGTMDLRGTYTVYVGDLPEAIEPCAPAADWTSEPDEEVTVYDHGHTDLRAGIKNGQLVLGIDSELLPLKQAVFAKTPPPMVVPEDASDRDYTSIGEPGTSFWYFPATSSDEDYLWPGFSTESIAPGDVGSLLSFTLNGYSVNGLAQPEGSRIVLENNMFTGAAAAVRPDFDTGRGITSFEVGPNVHAHPMWAFTAEGQYCVNLTVTALSPTGDTMSASGLMTFAVGDTAVAAAPTTPTCEQQYPDPATWPTLPSTIPDTLDGLAATTIDGARTGLISVEDDGEELSLPVLSGAGATMDQVVDAAHVVIPSADRLNSGGYGITSGRFQVSTEHLRGGTTTIELGDVEGPGVFTWHDNNRGIDVLSSATGVRTVQRTNPSRSTRMEWRFSAAGVYCVPITVTGPSGTSSTTTLTFAVGLADTSRIVACADGQHPGIPGGSGEEPEPDTDWDVPHHSLTDSGATILNNGHIDFASLLEDGTFVTRVKDTSLSNTPTWFDPADTVMQLLPGSKSTVPSNSAFSFLGDPGQPFWRVEQTQQPELIWPGWSTESIPAIATQAGVAWRLTDATGPGEFALYQSGAFGDPRVLFNTRDGISGTDAFEISKNTHAHGTWAFSAEGTYCLAFDRSASRTDGAALTDSFTIAVVVGEVAVKKTDPRACFTDPTSAPRDPDTTPVPVASLDDSNAGRVQVLDGSAGFTAGQLLTAQIATSRAGQWVSVWFDDTTWLGWAQIGSSGAIQVRVPAGATAGAHLLVVKTREGSLFGWDSLSVRTAQGPGDDNEPGELPNAVWDVPNGTINAHGAIVLNDGHVDIASVLDGTTLATRVKDSATVTEPVFRDPASTVLQLLPESRSTVPSSDAWSFLGRAGDTFYQVSQTQQAGLLWPGWSTESIPTAATTGGVAWSLTDFSGPGEFVLYETAGFGQPAVLFNTRDGITSSDRITIPKNTHAHGSWAFSAQGNYCLSMQRTAQLSSGQTASDTFVLAVAVGSADVMQVDPARCGESVNTDPVIVTPPAAEGAVGSDAPASQQVAATQCVAGATILSAGHIDYASRIVGGRLQSLIGDDTAGTKVYREPAGTVLWLKPTARVTLPSGFGQVGAAGTTVWQVPQTQKPDLIWLGWNTEALNAGNTHGPVRWSVDSIDGPGSVKVYLSGSFGGVQQMVFDNGGSYDIPRGVHAHANWAFSAEGVYRISTTQTATLANGAVSSDRETLTIVVGDVDPRTAVAGAGAGCGTISNAVLLSDDADEALQAADQSAADAARAARDQRPGGDAERAPSSVFDAMAAGNPVPVLLGILGALLLIGAMGLGLVWRRRRRVVGGDAE